MILIDPRIGTAHPDIADLRPLFTLAGIDTCHEPLLAGDLSFAGNGPAGPVMVGIERKRLPDLVASIHSGRLAAMQIPEMAEMYAVTYLVIEGRWRTNPDTGILEEWQENRRFWRSVTTGSHRHHMLTSELDAFLWSVETIGGCRLRWSSCPESTVRQVATLYRQWNKPWDHHKSFKVFADLQTGAGLERPSLARRVAKELPLIGWERSRSVEEHFGTVEAMVVADKADWLAIDGIGNGIANRVWKAIRSKEE